MRPFGSLCLPKLGTLFQVYTDAGADQSLIIEIVVSTPAFVARPPLIDLIYLQDRS